MADTTTHAGGVVFRRSGPGVEYLLVRPSDRADEWVLPKGHVEPGEGAVEAALREVREEAGVVARVIGPVAGAVRFVAKGKDINVRFFLMEWRGEAESGERRETRWAPIEEALKLVEYEQTRDVLREAERMRADHTSATD